MVCEWLIVNTIAKCDKFGRLTALGNYCILLLFDSLHVIWFEEPIYLCLEKFNVVINLKKKKIYLNTNVSVFGTFYT